jgi:hypothetical protein
MNNVATSLALAALMLSGAACGHDARELPAPWDEAVRHSALKDTPQIPVTSDMTPLLPRRRPWHVSLVVTGLDGPGATFCHGSLVAKGWVLTAASCVCNMAHKIPPMQVVVERGTSIRSPVALDVTDVFLYQDNQANYPEACFDPVADGNPITQANGAADYKPQPTIADLALIKLKVPDGNADKPEVLELIGGTDQNTEKLLGILADSILPPGSRVYELDSVLTAERDIFAPPPPGKIEVPRKRAFGARADYVLHTKARLVAVSKTPPVVVSCGTGSTSLGDMITTGNMSYVICNPFKVEAAAPSFSGTALLLADHKRPLGLGVYGTYNRSASSYRYTSVLQPAAVNSGEPIACWIDRLVHGQGSGSNGPFYAMKERASAPPQTASPPIMAKCRE